MADKTLFKADDVEVKQSSRGTISFAYSEPTNAMFDLYLHITKLEELVQRTYDEYNSTGNLSVKTCLSAASILDENSN